MAFGCVVESKDIPFNLHRFSAISSEDDRHVLPNGLVARHCSPLCDAKECTFDCHIRGISMSHVKANVKFQRCHAYLHAASKKRRISCYTIDPTAAVFQGFRFLKDVRNSAHTDKVHYLIQNVDPMPLAAFDELACMTSNITSKQVCYAFKHADVADNSSDKVDGSGAETSAGNDTSCAPPFVIGGPLPKRLLPVVPWIFHCAYEVLCDVFNTAIDDESADPNLLFDVLWYALDLVYVPSLFLGDCLPEGLAAVLARVRFSKLYQDEYSAELSAAVAQALHLNQGWDALFIEAGGSVLMMSVKMEQPLEESPQNWQPNEEGMSVTTATHEADAEEWEGAFALICRALATPRAAFSTIIEGVQRGQPLEILLTEAEDTARTERQSRAIKQILDILVGGVMYVNAPLVVELQFYRDYRQPGLAKQKARTLAHLLKQESEVSELIMAVGAGVMMMGPLPEGIALRPVFVEQSPTVLVPECRREMESDTLCISFVATRALLNGVRLAELAEPVVRTVRDRVFPCSTSFAVRYCGEAFDAVQWLQPGRTRDLWQGALNWEVNHALQSQGGPVLRCGVFEAAQGGPTNNKNCMLLLSWEPDFNKLCSRILGQAWPKGTLTGEWSHITVPRPVIA